MCVCIRASSQVKLGNNKQLHQFNFLIKHLYTALDLRFKWILWRLRRKKVRQITSFFFFTRVKITSKKEAARKESCSSFLMKNVEESSAIIMILQDYFYNCSKSLALEWKVSFVSFLLYSSAIRKLSINMADRQIDSESVSESASATWGENEKQ